MIASDPSLLLDETDDRAMKRRLSVRWAAAA